ncbi:unnamed protein product [Meganyctiphanes norvegica]|uniref:Ropporin-1-like protein n=1 Tax=Meganyctiphanes norvegica TaxID=48144 RepID=A0AAV2PP09_MEGNR
MVVSTVGDARVPGPLPRILKDYTKAAIRTQPRDLLAWSAAYFKAMSLGTVPPVKDRLEFPVPESSNGLTPGVLRVLHRQLNGEENVSWDKLQEVCEGMGVPESTVKEIWRRAGGNDDTNEMSWEALLPHAAKDASHSLVEALQMVMTAMTDDHVTQRVPVTVVLDHYKILYHDDNIQASDTYDDARAYLADIATYQDSYLTPSDLTRPSCPPLE